jgi:hypothetical protein
MLERSIAAGCPTFFEQTGDDTNDSANDFAPTTAAPRNSTSPITETTCPTLNVLLGGPVGGGTVAGGGINCPGVCSKQIALNTVVNLTATPVGANTFANWANCPVPNGAECEVTMDMSRTVTANFAAPPGGNPPATPPATPAPPKKKCKKGQKLKKGKCVKKKRKRK